MVSFELEQSVVVFDLDDTLYSELDYVESGIKYVCNQLEMLGVGNPYPAIQAERSRGGSDWIGAACNCAGLPLSARESLLWMYRLHSPVIGLNSECEAVVKEIRNRATAVAILTDGRSITQRLKLQALGLNDWPIYISEDYGSEKPSPERFEAIQERYPAQHYVYVGDNVKKDFLACNSLGWISIWLQGGCRNVHPQVIDSLPTEALPRYQASCWNDVHRLLCGTAQGST